MDQIEINGLRVMARHGYTKEEKMMEQEFEIDTILYCSLEKAINTVLQYFLLLCIGFHSFAFDLFECHKY